MLKYRRQIRKILHSNHSISPKVCQSPMIAQAAFTCLKGITVLALVCLSFVVSFSGSALFFSLFYLGRVNDLATALLWIDKTFLYGCFTGSILSIYIIKRWVSPTSSDKK